MDLPQTPTFDLSGQRALITGASSGIGLGAAVALARAGAHVVCAARRKTELDELVEALLAQGLSAETLVMDVADCDAVCRLLENLPAFDIAVNAAGIARHSSVLEANIEDYDQVMRVNARGAFVVMQQVARGMVAAKKKKGSIIHISSQMGLVGGVERSVYCASKHAVEGMMKAAAIELGTYNIRVNSICPTFIRTPLTEVTFENPARMQWVREKIKLNRTGEIEDIMGMVLYLASDASAMVTGASMLIDGGWTAG